MSLMRKSIIFWLTFALAALAALYLAVRVSMAVMGTGGVARVARISVHAGRNAENAQTIADALQIKPGGSAYSVNIEKSLAKLAARPDVRNAAVRRMPDGRIMVRVAVREIVAAWTDGYNFYPLSDDGRLLDKPLPGRPAGTLVFSGERPDNIARVIEILKGAPEIFSETESIERVEGRRWNLHMNSGVKVMLPESDLAGVVARLSERQRQTRILNRNISVLDMRDQERTLVKIRNP